MTLLLYGCDGTAAPSAVSPLPPAVITAAPSASTAAMAAMAATDIPDPEENTELSPEAETTVAAASLSSVVLPKPTVALFVKWLGTC